MENGVTTPAAISVEHVGKEYHKTSVLRDISFQAMSGECVAIVGGNGCGKSTLLQILAGAQSADCGTIRFFGTTASKRSKECRKFCGYVPQENPLFEELSVRDNLKFWSGGQKKNWDTIVRQFELDEMMSQKVEKLSGGMKRRLAIACALIEMPPIMLLDEPTVALDIYYKNSTLAWMEEYRRMNGTILMASHEEQEIVFADRCMLLHEGKMIEFSRERSERIAQMKEYLGR